MSNRALDIVDVDNPTKVSRLTPEDDKENRWGFVNAIFIANNRLIAGFCSEGTCIVEQDNDDSGQWKKREVLSLHDEAAFQNVKVDTATKMKYSEEISNFDWTYDFDFVDRPRLEKKKPSGGKGLFGKKSLFN